MTRCSWQSLDFEKENRYYCLVLQQDLLQSWVVTRIWGGKDRKAQQHRHEPHDSYEKALQRFQELAVYRELARRYKLCKKEGQSRIDEKEDTASKGRYNRLLID